MQLLNCKSFIWYCSQLLIELLLYLSAVQYHLFSPKEVLARNSAPCYACVAILAWQNDRFSSGCGSRSLAKNNQDHCGGGGFPFLSLSNKPYKPIIRRREGDIIAGNSQHLFVFSDMNKSIFLLLLASAKWDDNSCPINRSISQMIVYVWPTPVCLRLKIFFYLYLIKNKNWLLILCDAFLD